MIHFGRYDAPTPGIPGYVLRTTPHPHTLVLEYLVRTIHLRACYAMSGTASYAMSGTAWRT
eukprot:3940508-Rhodomonas_salina.3